MKFLTTPNSTHRAQPTPTVCTTSTNSPCKKDHLAFLNGRCSNHASRALDELGDFTTKIPTAELQNRLTPYGQYLTGAKSTTQVSPAPGIDGKVMYGTLGKSMRIVLKVDCKYGDFF
ncbi:hypothetical protein QWI28_12455 [Citrobacter freundii]|nr:hypothetical protein [Citrobacter freundii]